MTEQDCKLDESEVLLREILAYAAMVKVDKEEGDYEFENVSDPDESLLEAIDRVRERLKNGALTKDNVLYGVVKAMRSLSVSDLNNPDEIFSRLVEEYSGKIPEPHPWAIYEYLGGIE